MTFYFIPCSGLIYVKVTVGCWHIPLLIGKEVISAYTKLAYFTQMEFIVIHLIESPICGVIGTAILLGH